MPLLENSLLTPASIPNVSKLLSELKLVLQDASGLLTSSLVSYAFFPLSSILRRNASASIPDRVLEDLLSILGILCQRWWWNCDLATWDQIFMLCGAVIGGIEGKGKGKDRDDETKEAAAKCLESILRPRSPEEVPPGEAESLAQSRFSELVEHSQTPKLIPVVGETLSSLLGTVSSRHQPLQRVSLTVLELLVTSYAPDYLVPSVLPGIVSGMTKIALGLSTGKGWASGDSVSGSLKVMQIAIVRSIGDEVCIRDGAIRSIVNLEDLAGPTDKFSKEPKPSDPRPYATTRTASWLQGTGSQLHIAVNTLTPLVSHPTPVALNGFTEFSATLLGSTSLTLPQTQPLLLSFLLSLSNSDFESVANHSHQSLSRLLSPTFDNRRALLQTMMSITRDNLSALPRIIPSQADAKIEHVAGQIEAVARLAVPRSADESSKITGLSTISDGIGKLLGANGGIEKWGWNLLSVLEFENPPVTISRASTAQLMLENDPEGVEWVPFPEVTLRNVSSRNAYNALSRMLRSLGHAGGDPCLFAVEWFVEVGRNGHSARAVAALWCASRLLEGIADINIDSVENAEMPLRRRNKRLEKFSRGLAKSVAELWDFPEEQAPKRGSLVDDPGDQDNLLPTEFRRGTVSIRATKDVNEPAAPKRVGPTVQPLLHRALCLQLLSITAGILQARFNPLFINVLYPILHSIVSPVMHLSSTALASLTFITNSTSYASPANLLLSNFDYALDAVSRHLTRRWLDADATKVLVVLVRLVGSDVVQKAGDVVEECFDRLDDFHGYEIIVEGLVEVLGEVIKVVQMDEKAERTHLPEREISEPKRHLDFDKFNRWYVSRHGMSAEEVPKPDHGSAPQSAWGKGKDKELPVEEKEEEDSAQTADISDEAPLTPTQALTKQIVSRSLYFLTHGSPVIRARILVLLCSSVPVLSDSALLPSIHQAWPFIMNRLVDTEPFVVSAAAGLVESLANHFGSFMFRRIWDDVWPRFQTMLDKLNTADASNALSRRGSGAVGTESAYSQSHRLYRSLLITMIAAAKGVEVQDSSVWQVIIAFRRFLHKQAHDELQSCARDLYIALGKNNDDAVWLALFSTKEECSTEMAFMMHAKWDIETNVALVMDALEPSSK